MYVAGRMTSHTHSEGTMTKTVALMRRTDGVCVEIIETDADYAAMDRWEKLSDCLPAERIARLQHCGVCVDADTEIYAALA